MSIGFGKNDPNLKPGENITVARAFELLKEAIGPRVKDLNRWLKVQLKQHEFDALFSMYYQSGGKFLRKEGLIHLINLNRADEALARWPQFDTKTVKQLDGKKIEVHDPNLKRRRLREQHLYRTGDYGTLSPIPIWRNGFPGPWEWYHVQPEDFRTDYPIDGPRHTQKETPRGR